MSFDPTLYSERKGIKDGIRSLKLSHAQFAVRAGYPPSTFSNKLNGSAPMTSQEETKILADIEAMKEA